MKEIFGIPMTTIMVTLIVMFAMCAAAVAGVFLANRVMFRMGLRNTRRRGLQTGLVVAGLMLATVIITAAFTTGDTLNYSITKITYDNLQRTDLVIQFGGAGESDLTTGGASANRYIGSAVVPALESRFAADADIEGFLPFLFEPAPVLNPRTRLSEARVTLAGVDPERLGRLGGLRLTGGGRADLGALGPDEALVSARTADKLDVRRGDRLTVIIQEQPLELTVAGIVEDEFAGGVFTLSDSQGGGGIVALLPTVQRITNHPEQINFLTVVLRGDVRTSVRRSDSAAPRLEAFLDSDEGRGLLGSGRLGANVDKAKQKSVEQAELIGNGFTAIFLLMGLFSIAAGVMLIFTLFVMLAAERRTEMGIARAVGAKRSHLVQMFVAEGMAYDLFAGVIGVALGVAAGFFLIIGGFSLVFGDDFGFVEAHVTPASLVVSFCLGAVLTFITVVLSSLRISRLNIVAAVRGQDEGSGRHEQRRRTRWPWVALGVPALIVPPLGLYWLLRKGLGLPWAWIVGPLGIVLGGLLMWLGEAIDQDFPFSLGISIIPLAVAALARYQGAPSRLTWSAVGVLLLCYWMLPLDLSTRLFGSRQGNMEMFVLSGIMIVAGFTLVIVFNARLLTALAGGGNAYRTPLALVAAVIVALAAGRLLGDSGGGIGPLFYLLAVLPLVAAVVAFAAVRFPWFAPAVKMGVAYPLANRFRTGMTIAMFSLTVFSITVMTVIEDSMLESLFGGEESLGGWHLQVESNRNNPIDDLRLALREEGSFDPAQITAIGRTTQARVGQEVRQVGQEEWEGFMVRAGDDAFFAANQAVLEGRARGYADDGAVYEAVRTTPSLALLDSQPLQSETFNAGAFSFHVDGVTINDRAFNPFQVEYRDPITGNSALVTVVGVLSAKIPSNIIYGLYVSEAAYTSVYGQPDYELHYVRLVPSTEPEAAVKAIEAALVMKGVQAVSFQEIIDAILSQSRGLMRVIQAFMGLGLFVGIAALGVVAYRSVVERRQQIGMLRAIGFQRVAVTLSFLLEASFIALMGILSGVVGAAVLSRNLLTSDWFNATQGLTFRIPWIEVIGLIVIAYGFALLMTWWPSRGAARVTIAEALRYE